MSETFKLLQLPFFALEQVLKEMSVLSLLELSQTSKRASQLVKLGDTAQFRTLIEVAYEQTNLRIMSKHDFLKIVITKKRKYARGTEPRRYDNRKVQIRKFPRDLHIYCDNALQGLLSFSLHITDLFGCTINRVKTRGISQEKSATMMNWLMDRQNVIETLEMEMGEAVPFDVLLTRLRVTDKLILDGVPSLTLGTLLELNCRIICLKGSQLTNQDLDFYFQKWKSGGFPTLKHLVIMSDSINNQTPIAGIMLPAVNPTRGQADWLPFFNRMLDINAGAEVQREDGVKAWIQVHTDFMKTFSLFVCD